MEKRERELTDAERRQQRQRRERIQHMVEQWKLECEIVPLMIAPRGRYVHTTSPCRQRPVR